MQNEQSDQILANLSCRIRRVHRVTVDERPAKAQQLRALALTLRNLRQKAGISQEQLELAAGTSRKHVNKVEAGYHALTLPMLCRLLPHLGVSLVEFREEFDRCLRAHEDWVTRRMS